MHTRKWFDRFDQRTALLVVLAAQLLGSAALAQAPEEPESYSRRVVTVTGRVLTEPGGVGVPDATVVVQTGLGYGLYPVTDRQGIYSFVLESAADTRHPSMWIDRRCLPPGVQIPPVGVPVAEDDVLAPNLCMTLPQSVSGVVRDASTGEPIPGATVRCTGCHDLESDENGRFRCYVTPGKVTLSCQGTPYRYYPCGAREEWYGTKLVFDIQPGQNVDGVDFELESASPIRGTVVDSGGVPVQDATVMVHMEWPVSLARTSSIDMTQNRCVARTGEDGSFVAYLRRPPHVLEILKESPIEEPASDSDHRKTLAGAEPDTVILTALAWSPDRSQAGVTRNTGSIRHQAPGPLSITLSRSAEARFRILDLDGRPLEHLHIGRWDGERRMSFHKAFPIHELGEGRYRLSGLVAGFDTHIETEKGFGYLQSKITGIQPGARLDLGDLKLRGEVSENLDEILAGIGDRSSSSRVRNAWRIGATALSDEEVDRVVKTLLSLINDTSELEMVDSVIQGLGLIGPRAGAAVAALVWKLESPDCSHRWRAAEALGRIGDPVAIPALKVALDDPVPRVREHARVALDSFAAKPRTSPGE